MDPLTQCGGSHGPADIELATKVSGTGDTSNLGIDVHPVLGPEKLPSLCRGAECETFLCRNCSTQAVEVAECYEADESR